MYEKLSGYLQVLAEAGPESIGGALPRDDFYYGN
jgi:NitT/TauT family transport system substrate-binding protein